jgi:hypothetical protein
MQMLSVNELVAGSDYGFCCLARCIGIWIDILDAGLFPSTSRSCILKSHQNIYIIRKTISYRGIYNLHKSSSSIVHHQNKLIYNLPPRFRFIETEIKVSQSFTRCTHPHRIPPSSRNRYSRRSITCPSR